MIAQSTNCLYRAAALAVLTALGMLLGCDYPEQGFYTLIALDGYEMPVASWPLMVEELADDTSMTYGFNALFPVDGELVEVPLSEASDTTRRGWLLILTNGVTGAGELDLTLSHSADLLSFGGAYQPPAAEDGSGEADVAPVYPLGGLIRPAENPGVSRLVINGNLAPLAGGLAGARRFELRPLTREQFEAALGCSVEDAPRRSNTGRDALEVNAEVPDKVDPAEETAGENDPADDAGAKDEAGNEPDSPAHSEKPSRPPLGGRRGNRPR